MLSVLLKAFGFIFIIILGYMLKKLGFFESKDYRLISKIMMNITLPAAVVTAFANFERNNSLFFVVLLGLVCNIIMLLIGFLMSRKKDDSTKALYMLNFPGYNIGSFTMPYVQSFLGPFGVVVTCMFDTGNAIMCTGATYAATSSIVSSGGKISAKGILRKLVSSVPFDTYMLMLILSSLGLRLPVGVIAISSNIGAANGFLAMLMIGMMFEVNLEPSYIKQIIITLLTRYSTAAIFALLFYFGTPFSLEIRQVLAILVFAPISALSPVFTEKCKGNVALSSLIGSISILISIVIMTILLIIMNIG